MHRLSVRFDVSYGIEVFLRPLRRYLCKELCVADRVECVLWHFSWLHIVLNPYICRALLNQRQFIIDQKSGANFGINISLRRAVSHSREGEFSLDLLFHGNIIFSASFSVVNTRAADISSSAGSIFLIAGIQGARGTENEVRALSNLVHRLRPAALLICALQGLCAGWNLPAPIAVSTGSHVMNNNTGRRKRAGFDYDVFWRESGALPIDNRYWRLPPSPFIRPVEQVASKHRGQHRRRSEFKIDFFEGTKWAASQMTQIDLTWSSE